VWNQVSQHLLPYAAADLRVDCGKQHRLASAGSAGPVQLPGRQRPGRAQIRLRQSRRTTQEQQPARRVPGRGQRAQAYEPVRATSTKKKKSTPWGLLGVASTPTRGGKGYFTTGTIGRRSQRK